MRSLIRAVALPLLLGACDRPSESGVPVATVLSPENADHRGVRFSPDGKLVAYWNRTDKGYDLVVAKPDLREPRTVAQVTASSGWISWSPDGTKLAYPSDESGTPNVGVVSATGGDARRVTNGLSADIPIAWHASGDRVSFIVPSPGGTFLTKAVSLKTGASAPLLSESRPHLAQWSPDGSRIAYNLIEGSRTTIWVADSTGANARQLTTEGFEGFDGFGMPWSPDGTMLAFISRRTGTGDIWVIPVAGGAARQLTHDIRNDNQATWSHDSRWIAFLSTRGRQTDVWVVPAAGGQEIRASNDVIEESDVQWVGHGLTLAFIRPSLLRSLWAVGIEDGKARRLTPDSILIGTSRPALHGDEVAYVVSRGGGVAELRVLSLSSGTSRTVVGGSSNIGQPAWSPDGKTLLFHSDRAGTADIWTVSSAGGAPRQITSWSGFEINPAWSRDGSTLYFGSNHESRLADIWSVPVAGGAPKRLTTVGNVNGSIVVSPTGDLFFTRIGGSAGTFELTKMTLDGKLQTMWTHGNVFGVTDEGFTPSGDSVAIFSSLPDGGRGTLVISTRTGEGRRVLGKNEFGGDFSPDGTHLVYLTNMPKGDYALLNVRDGTTRQLTHSPESAGNYRLTADGKTLVVVKTTNRRRIVTVDMTRALTK